MIRDSGRAFLEYEVDPEPNDATLSLSLFEGGKLVEDGGDDTKKVAEGGNDGGSGVDKGLSNMDGAMLERGDSPSSYLRAKKLLSSPSSSEAGELVSVSVVCRLERPASERLWRTRVTGVISGSCGGKTPREVESRGERGGEESAIERAEAVSPSEKGGSSRWSSSWSASTRKRELIGEGSGEWSKADMGELSMRCLGITESTARA